MPEVLLLHTNRQYATSLARTVHSIDVPYDVDTVSREPLSDRLSHVLDGRYDLIQVDELLVNGVLAAMGSVLTGAPMVAAVRGWADYTNAHGQHGRLRDATIRLRTEAVRRRASNVIFLSDRTREEFESRYEVDKWDIIGRPIDVEYYRGGEATETDTFDLLTLTNLRYGEKYDGVVTVLRGLESIFDRYDALRFKIAGGGSYLDDLYEFLDSYRFADRVDVLGFRKDVPDLLASADAFVYVSFLDAYPTVILEAQAAGLPVIGGDAVGVPETVGTAGMICRPEPDALTSTIERVVTDDEHRTALAAESKEKMIDYNEQCARRHVEVWDRVLNHS